MPDLPDVSDFMQSQSLYEIMFEFSGYPTEVAIMGSGTDLDALGGWKGKVSGLNCPVMAFNEKAGFFMPKVDIWVVNRAHRHKVLKRAARLIASGKSPNLKAFCICDHRDKGTSHGELAKEWAMLIRRDLDDPLNSILPEYLPHGKQRYSCGFYGAMFLKHCKKAWLAGFDGYLNRGRKENRWHSETGRDTPAAKHHDLNAEFRTMMAIVKARGDELDLSMSAAAAESVEEQYGIEANTWA